MSSNSHLFHNISRYFYIDILPCGKRNLILNLLPLLRAFSISFGAANLLVSKLLTRLGGPRSLVLATLFAVT